MIMPGRCCWPILVVAVWTAAANAHAQFTGMFTNGTRFQGARLAGWPEGKGQPHVSEWTWAPFGACDFGAVFDVKNPVSWLFNETADPPSAPRPCVELFGGDRLPGQVVGYRYGSELIVERQSPHLLVKLDPDAVRSPHTVVRVRVQLVRKVIWQPRR